MALEKLCSLDWSAIGTWVGSVGTIATVIFMGHGLKKQMGLSFFSEYTKRYQEIILNFPESINQQDFDFDTLTKQERDKTLRYMRAYFDLCSEEYFLWKHGNIDKNTWKEWESGIRFAFSKTAFSKAWEILRLDTIYYGEFTAWLTKS